MESNDTDDTDTTEENDENYDKNDTHDNNENKPVRRTLGSFMTPGPKRNIFPTKEAARPSGAEGTGPGRYSLGGGEARRVLVEKPWKVKDLVVPLPPAPSESNTNVGTPRRESERSTSPTRPRLTPSVSTEERRAIQERRRSAVQDLKSHTGIWEGGAPGMSPAKSSGERSTSPAKPGSGMFRPIFGSPTKGKPLDQTIPESEENDEDLEPNPKIKSLDDSDEFDTQGLLERMKETVEGMKFGWR